MRVYLDHNATSPLRDEVVEAMLRVLRGIHGNPSSAHEEGRAARAAVDRARASVASLIGIESGDVLFTGGATEANNTALLGMLGARAGAAGHLVSSTVEHPSVEAPLASLERAGWRVTRVGVDSDGLLDAAQIEAAIEAETALVSILWANNETGVLQPIERIAAVVRARGIPFHVDATQAVGKIPIDLRKIPVDLLSLSAHKFNGPKGVGCLIARGDLVFESVLRGGPQERGRRGGTENVAACVGLGVACDLAQRELGERERDYAALRDRLWDGIRAKVTRVRRNGSADSVLPNTLNVEFDGAAGELLLQALDVEGIAVSSGAACHSGSIEPSKVLIAMGRSPEQARGSLRFSIGHGNDAEQIDYALSVLPDRVESARQAVGA
ncbi:MAG: cysteine desulfurase [Deltaproteobacteria bacterium]|jgi:cysteine desulfurase|nr:cysteine desulfurase [Deltaproteobacteria bacterium]